MVVEGLEIGEIVEEFVELILDVVLEELPRSHSVGGKETEHKASDSIIDVVLEVVVVSVFLQQK